MDSFNIEFGLSTHDIEEANINQTMFSMSKEVIAVLDSSKFNKRNFVFIAPVNKIHTVVTDNNIPSNIKTQIKSMNIALYTVEPFSIP